MMQDLFGGPPVVELNGLKFHCRPDTSDFKTVKEIVGGAAYEKTYFKIEAGQHWLDLGGNIGAFSVLAASKGCTVDVYEPDPEHCELIRLNAKINGFADRVNIHQAAVTLGEEKRMKMFIGNNGNTWRNSLIKNWGNGGIEVDCVPFHDLQNPEVHCKMDIEGYEMPLLENHTKRFKRLVYEWSFDVDDNIDRYRVVALGLEDLYDVVKAPSINEKYHVWQKSWFPPCKNVFCY